MFYAFTITYYMFTTSVYKLAMQMVGTMYVGNLFMAVQQTDVYLLSVIIISGVSEESDDDNESLGVIISTAGADADEFNEPDFGNEFDFGNESEFGSEPGNVTTDDFGVPVLLCFLKAVGRVFDLN